MKRQVPGPFRPMQLLMVGLITCLSLQTTSAQEGAGSARDQVAGIVEKAQGLPIPDLVQLAGEAVAQGEDTAYIEALEEAVAQAHPEAKLVLGKALLELDEAPKAKDALLALVQPEVSEELSVAAVRFLNHPRFKRNQEVESKLTDLLGQDLLPARVRLYAASTLYNIGSGESRNAARRELRAFLKSDQDDLRNEGALCLAESNDLETARPVLKKLAKQPTEQGRLAQFFLDREELERMYERKIKNIDQYYKEQSTKAPSETVKDLTDLGVLEDVIRNAQYAHVRGGKYTRDELVTAAARGILNLLDPYSTFITGEEYKRFIFDINQDYGGIGAFVRNINDVFTIVRPIYSGPAYGVGLRSDDKILAVDGWSTAGKGEDEIIKRLKGKPGTLVKVMVYRAGWQDPKEFEIIRDQINVPVLQYEMFPGKIGYFELISFSRDAAKELENAILDLQQQGMEGMVLDLRNDPGGLLDAAVEVCELFLPADSLVVYTESRLEGKKHYPTRRPPKISAELPLTVLVNERSASASEIVSGALQFHGRATIIGEPTFGKGSVQTLIPLRALPDEPYVDENRNYQWDQWESYSDLNENKDYDYGPRIKITVARYFFPNGKSIHTETDKMGRVVEKGGVTPDFEVEFDAIDRCNIAELERVLSIKSKADPELDVFREYVQAQMEKNVDLFVTLANGDSKDISKYPGFEEFYKSLDTFLDRDDVRKWVRVRIREMVSDARGKVFPGQRFLGDYQEDPQLQKALESVLKKMGLTPEEIPEYQQLFAGKGSPESKNPRRGG